MHERDAHESLVEVIDQVQNDPAILQPVPPLVVHCFTGTESEALEYIRRGYYIGFTGTICKKERGAPLRDILPKLPLERLMIETDAPFMGFKKDRRGSEPADTVGVAEQLAKVMNVDTQTVCDITTHTILNFFRLSGLVGQTQPVVPVKKSKEIDGANGKVVVGMASTTTVQQEKSKSALRREKEKKQAEVFKSLTVQHTLPSTVPSVDPEKRARKLKKTLREIDNLNKKDASKLNDDQKKKIKLEQDLQDELAKPDL